MCIALQSKSRIYEFSQRMVTSVAIRTISGNVGWRELLKEQGWPRYHVAAGCPVCPTGAPLPLLPPAQSDEPKQHPAFSPLPKLLNASHQMTQQPGEGTQFLASCSPRQLLVPSCQRKRISLCSGSMNQGGRLHRIDHCDVHCCISSSSPVWHQDICTACLNL